MWVKCVNDLPVSTGILENNTYDMNVT